MRMKDKGTRFICKYWVIVVILVAAVVFVVDMCCVSYTVDSHYEMRIATIHVEDNCVYLYSTDNTVGMRVRSDKLCTLLSGHEQDTIDVTARYWKYRFNRVWYNTVVSTTWNDIELNINSGAIKYTLLESSDGGLTDE